MAFIVVALGSVTRQGFLYHLEYAAAVAGAGILDTADFVEGRR